MRRRSILTLLVLLASSPIGAQSPRVTPAQRAAITAEIRAIVDTVYMGARTANFDLIDKYAASEDGICVMQTQISNCGEVRRGFRESWSSKGPDRLLKQEMDSVETKVQVISPDVAIAARTTQRNKAHYANGKTSPARFASLVVFVREGGRWKQIALQQAGWPIEPAGK